MADFVRGNPQGDYPAEIIDGISMHRRIDVMTDNLAEVKEAREWFRPQTRRVAPITLDVMWDHFLSQHWAQLSPDLPLDEFVRYAERQIVPILPDSPPRFVNLNQYLWSERWLERYRENGFYSARAERHGQPPSTSRGATRLLAGSGYPLRPSGDAVLALLSADDAPGRKQTAVIATSLIGKSWLNDC
ncbi:acyl carrier protein phosphodiesterase [Serratia liquefaciens]|nr:acyl carrier protein phosphodiesterase [Serratia liquefaciens]